MGDFVYNVAKGRAAELYKRVDENDPANSALELIALDASGLESDSVLKDKETLSAVLAGTTAEATNTGYVRKILTDVDIVAFAPDHVNDKVVLDIPDQTYTGVAAGSNWAAIVLCYDPDTTGGTDADLVPNTNHSITITPDGNDINLQVPNGYFQAS